MARVKMITKYKEKKAENVYMKDKEEGKQITVIRRKK